MRACALRSANLLNKADLARDVGIAPSTANQWLSILEASGQIILLEPWFSNKILLSRRSTLQNPSYQTFWYFLRDKRTIYQATLKEKHHLVSSFFGPAADADFAFATG